MNYETFRTLVMERVHSMFSELDQVHGNADLSKEDKIKEFQRISYEYDIDMDCVELA